MPRRKASRACTSRAKPVAPSISVTMPDLEAEEQKRKLELILKDFDGQVAERVSEMEKELEGVLQSIQNIYTQDLSRYSDATRKMLWVDYVNQDKTKNVPVRTSVDSLLNSADLLLAASKPKKGRPKKNSGAGTLAAPPSATRSTRNNRQKNVLGVSQADNIVPPPSTLRAPRSRKIKMDAAATPANQGVGSMHMSSLMVTPKFDPRTPLPPGTLKRKPMLGEIAMSLSGSPLQVSPKSLLSNLTVEDVDEETKEELKLYYERIGKLLDM